MKKTIAIILATLLITTFLAGCGNKGQDAEKKDTIIAVGKYACETFDPTSGNVMDEMVSSGIFDSLTRFDENAQVAPSLAESWTLSDDGLTYTFKLRQDVKFHDGNGFSADDVIYTLDTMLEKPQYGYIKAMYVVAWEKVDDYTVKISRPASYIDMLSMIAYQISIVPKAVHEKSADEFAKAPVGTGAYKFVSQGNDSSVTLVANEEYFRGVPEIKNAIVRVPLDASTAVVALENNEVDLIFGVPAVQIPILDKNENVKRVTASTYGSMTLSIYDNGLNDDINLRKAIFHGINRQNVITLATEGIAKETKNLFAELVMKDLAGKVTSKGYDEALAKEYLAKSNYKSGTELTITCTSKQATIAQALQGDLNKIGLNIKIEQLESNAWSEKLRNGEIQLNLSGLGAVSASAVDLLIFFESQNPTMGSRMGKSADYDAVIKKIKEATSQDEINDLAIEAMKLQFELANIVPLYEVATTFAYSSAITNIPDTYGAAVCYLGNIKLNK